GRYNPPVDRRHHITAAFLVQHFKELFHALHDRATVFTKSAPAVQNLKPCIACMDFLLCRVRGVFQSNVYNLRISLCRLFLAFRSSTLRATFKRRVAVLIGYKKLLESLSANRANALRLSYRLFAELCRL